MISRAQPLSSKQSRAGAAVRLAQVGDLDAARSAFEEAIALDRRNPDLYFNLALVEEQSGNADAAASRLSILLDLKPNYPQAASRLARLLARFQISDVASLSPNGIKAALLAPGINHQPIADVAFAWLFDRQQDLANSMAQLQIAAGNERSVGQALIAANISTGLTHELLLLALRTGTVKHHRYEQVLTAVRAALLLDCGLQRLTDRRVMELAVAVMTQGWSNDHAWHETAEETAALSALKIDRAKLASGEIDASCRYLLHALYRPLEDILDPPLSVEDARLLKPRILKDAILRHLEDRQRQQEFARSVPSLKPLADATSRKVASQYEAAPYPRWQSLHRSREGSLKAALGRHVGSERLSFMDSRFDVFIAGCGTGQQALQAATAYGPNARLLAMDLSAASLGYAVDMAKRHAIDNVEFVRGDILDCGLLDRDFDVIECVGVLHHMANWRAGWTELLRKLKPNGLMYVGLYSATSRANLRNLRSEPSYPGPGCSNDAARKYRRELLVRTEGQDGSELKFSRDFYALNAFRDLVLHESEAHVTLDEITEFLDTNGLVFRGFTLEHQVEQEFAAAFPTRPLPGTLADWAAFERTNPRTFDAMYRFWIERRN